MLSAGIVVCAVAQLLKVEAAWSFEPLPSGALVIGENSDAPWPANRGEVPPPKGSVSLIDIATGDKRVLQAGLTDPVWVTSNATHAFVGLFHSGEIAAVAQDAPVQTMARGLSCPEDIALDRGGALWVVENPVGNECQGINLIKDAHLTRIDSLSRKPIRTARLSFPHGMDIDRNQGESGVAYVCESGIPALTRVDLTTGVKSEVVRLVSPSGCAVGGGHAYVVEQGSNNGALVDVALTSQPVKKTTLLSGLAGPMGVALDARAGVVYVGVRHQNEVVGVNLTDGTTRVVASNLNSPIGLAVVGA